MSTESKRERLASIIASKVGSGGSLADAILAWHEDEMKDAEKRIAELKGALTELRASVMETTPSDEDVVAGTAMRVTKAALAARDLLAAFDRAPAQAEPQDADKDGAR